ncbi:hypothetical protein FSP39_011092 [Pinctada imbricata]|uniref:Uncharacterized protein n=1 Tax=Pinctada imbricata TaxID=66713 RepID=A0AA88Y7E5_PINIB|nr:hypothetical protein FSP39_011092 [Pinctada imbricata]
MGKKGKKRKTDDISNQSLRSTQSENSSRGRSVSEQHAVSFMLNEANNILYRTPDERYCAENAGNAENAENIAYVSTPLIAGNACSTSSQFAEINQKLEFIMQKLQKLDVIEERMNRLDTRMDSLESRVVATEKINDEFEKSVKYVSGKCDEFQLKSNEITALSKTMEKQRKDITDLSDNIERQKAEMEKLNREMAQATEKKKELEESVLDLRCRSMKYNLVFTGVDGESREENTEGRIRDFIYYDLGIDSHMEFCNVHRFGRFVRGKCRPIVARFVYNQDRDAVLRNAYKLKGTQCGVHEQFPKEVEDKRRELYPIVKDLKRSGNTNVKLVRDKLYVNGRLYNPGTPSSGRGTAIDTQPVGSAAEPMTVR